MRGRCRVRRGESGGLEARGDEERLNGKRMTASFPLVLRVWLIRKRSVRRQLRSEVRGQYTDRGDTTRSYDYLSNPDRNGVDRDPTRCRRSVLVRSWERPRGQVCSGARELLRSLSSEASHRLYTVRRPGRIGRNRD